MSKEERPFLKRKPNIFLVGNMEQSGFKTEEQQYGRDKHIDEDGIAWYEAITTACFMMFTHEPKPKSLSSIWLGDTLYQEEFPIPEVKFGEQGYEEYYDLSKQAQEDPTKIQALFDYTPPIIDYAIPPPKTAARRVFTHAVRMAWKDLQRANENRDKLRKKLLEIGNIYGVGFR